jgi:hypothetical protein
MAILSFLGFEDGGFDFGGAGTRSIQSTVKRTGNYALRVNPTTTNTGSVVLYRNSATGGFANFGTLSTFMRIYFRADLLPASGSEEVLIIASGTPATSNRKLTLRINSTGTLALYDSTNTLAATGSTVLSTGIWYCIMVQSTTSATASSARVWLNQTSASSTTYEIDTTMTQNNVAVEAPWLGKVSNSSGQSVDFYYDDILVADTPSHCTAGEVVRATYSTQGTNSWNVGTGTSTFAECSEVPSDGNTTYIQSIGSTTSEDFIVTCDTRAGLGLASNAMLRGIQIYARSAFGTASTQNYTGGIDTGSGTITYNSVTTESVQPTYGFKQWGSYSPTVDLFGLANPQRISLRASNGGTGGAQVRCTQLITEYSIQYAALSTGNPGSLSLLKVGR